jgi:neutral ceramidase
VKAVACLICCAASSVFGAGFQAGVARVEITPREAIWMSGYASRSHPSTGIRQALWAKALAIQSGSGRPTVIVSTDLVGLPAEVADEVAVRVHRQFGVERSRLLLNSSHTHTGPVVWPGLAAMFDLPPGEEQKLHAYAARLVGDLVSVIGKSIADLSPAVVSYGFGEAGFAMNRREPTAKGIRIGVNPSGPTDHQVPVLLVSTPAGKKIAILFAYTCHNTTLTGDFYELSGDYAGVAAVKLETEYPGTTALFLQLCGGDQNPYPRNTVELAEQHGGELAAAVDRVIGGRLASLKGTIRTSYVVTSLAFAPQPRSAYQMDLDNPKSTPAARQRAMRMLASMDAGRPIRDTAYPVQAIRFGNSLTLLALGGEVVVDYDLRAHREYPGEALIVAGYSNAVMCYIPSERVLGEGGYEVVDNMVYYGQPGPFAPGVENGVFRAIHQAMKEVGQLQREGKQ